MVIKMDTMGAAHAANAINYVLDKEKARKEDKPVFLVSNNIDLNPLTGKPFSPVDVLMDMQLRQASSRHRVEEPFWRIELCPPTEVCRRWTMPQWDIDTYFAGMRSNGFEVEPICDRLGICRGYSIGEKLYDLDGNYSSTGRLVLTIVLYKASAKKFGHGRDLTVSKLYGTWLREHPEMERAEDDSRRWHRHKPQKTVMPHNAPTPSKTNDDDEYQRLLKAKKGNKEPTRGERERETAIWDAVRAVREFVKSPFRESFHLREQEDILPEGIVAKAIDMEQEAGLSFSESSLKDAAEELLEMVESSAGRAAVAAEGLQAVVAQIALPEEQPSLGGGGAASNDLPRKKDDEWEWWKKNGFIRSQRNKGIKR